SLKRPWMLRLSTHDLFQLFERRFMLPQLPHVEIRQQDPVLGTIARTEGLSLAEVDVSQFGPVLSLLIQSSQSQKRFLTFSIDVQGLSVGQDRRIDVLQPFFFQTRNHPKQLFLRLWLIAMLKSRSIKLHTSGGITGFLK